LLQGKQSNTTSSPAGPAPIPRWRLDHGRLRLGRRRPWLELLRLRSGHARHPLLRRPRLQAGQRRGPWTPWPRRCFLERGDLRLQAAAVSSVQRRSSAGPLSLLFFSTYSGAAAPNPWRGSDGRACGMCFTPSAAKGLAPGRRSWSPPLPPSSSTPPSLIFGEVAVDLGGKSPSGGAVQGDRRGTLYRAAP
jgi:hypothetical protein